MNAAVPHAVAPPAPRAAPAAPRAFGIAAQRWHCRCGRPIFFRNARCLACGTPIGYDSEAAAMRPLERAEAGAWRAWGDADPERRWWRCVNADTAAGCNWLVAGRAGQAPPQRPRCRNCALNRVEPDTSSKQHRLWWRRVEVAKRRLVASMLALGLPLVARVGANARAGLAFDVLREDAAHARVVTGYDAGVITVNLEEADDTKRARVRAALRQPCLTLLGHLRHEVGHYWRERLVMPGDWREPFRELFGDERRPESPPDEAGDHGEWSARHVSAFAARHPALDWAETFAHYLHIVDTLATAATIALDTGFVERRYEPYTESSLYRRDAGAAQFLELINDWMDVTGALNEFSRSMGYADFCPFVLAGDAVRKLHFVHLVVAGSHAYQRASP